jgi:CheY-like chemotaxis protein
MPRLDGLEATKQFRSWERAQPPPAAGGARARLPIIALSANVFHETIADCTAAGMDGAAPSALGVMTCFGVPFVLTHSTRDAGFLPKPLRLDALRAVLATHNLLSPAAV